MVRQEYLPGSILDHVWRANEFTVRQALTLVLSASRSGFTTVLPASTNLSMTTLAPVTLTRAPTASATATTALVGRALGDSYCTLGRIFGGEVGLQTGRETGNGSIWSISDSRRLWRVVIGFGKCLGSGVVARVRAVIEVCGLCTSRQPIIRKTGSGESCNLPRSYRSRERQCRDR
jgi:hypothetical protein